MQDRGGALLSLGAARHSPSYVIINSFIIILNIRISPFR